MLYVLGLGVETPQTRIDNSFIKKLNPAFDVASFEQQFGIRERRSSLPVEYIEKSASITPEESFKNVTKTPIDLSHASALKALQSANIQQEQIGLVLGDCATPTQTCPSEGQRLGSRLGIKVPAYDIIAGAGAFIVHLSTIFRWKEDRCPEYMLGTTSGTVTHTIDYSKGVAGAFFGDGAASYVLSAKHPGKFKVVDVGFKTDAHVAKDLRVETYGRIHVPDSYVSEYVRPQVKETLAELKAKYGDQFSSGKFIGAQSDVAGSAQSAIAAGFQEKNILSNGHMYGDMIGASLPSVLAENAHDLKKGEKIFVAHSGLGIARGYIVFEVME